MTAAEREQLIDALTVMAEYYDKPKSDAQIMIYVQALDDLKLADISWAMNDIIKSSPFFPKVSEIREMVLGDDQDSAEIAWMGLLREVRRTGYTGYPDLPEATLEAIRGVWGSWVNLCQTLPGEGPELLGWAKRFGSAYVATKHQLERRELPGREEAKQLLDGIKARVPKQLPDASRRDLPALREGAEDAGDDHARQRDTAGRVLR